MTTVLDGVDRAALARAALARAEQRTGARSGLRVTTRPSATSAVPPAGTSTAPAGTSTAAPASASPSRGWQHDGPTASTVPSSTPASITHPDRPPLPVAPALAPLLPEGALRRGSSLVVTGSTSLLLALVARASQEGSWVAAVGMPGVGLLAAQQAGVVLDRLALVPQPGPDAPTVVAALLDGVDLVIVGDCLALVDADRRRLMARARERGAVLLSTVPWSGANVVLTAEPVEWTGLGHGHGHLRRHRLAVTRGGRGSAGRGARAEVVLPVRPGAAAPQASVAPVRRPAEVPAAPLRLVG
jgi:surface antigen